MPRRSDPPDALSRLSSDTRIFVALTLAEASALVTQFQLDPQAAALSGLAKIRSVLEHATPMVMTPVGPVPPLRAKAYRPRTEPLRMAKATLPAKRPTAVSIDTAAAAPQLDDYVPFRDEADGVYT
jgi:hypothetical protein